jgi:hypothetical protein
VILPERVAAAGNPNLRDILKARAGLIAESRRATDVTRWAMPEIPP